MSRLEAQATRLEPATCPECGASWADGFTCWDKLGWEAQDPELAGEHFLTVAGYNLQHPAQFTDAALANLREGFSAHLDTDLSIKMLRQGTSQVFEGRARVLRPEAERAPVLRRWPLTIDDVYAHNQPDHAAERVREWAAAIRREL